MVIVSDHVFLAWTKGEVLVAIVSKLVSLLTQQILTEWSDRCKVKF